MHSTLFRFLIQEQNKDVQISALEAQLDDIISRKEDYVNQETYENGLSYIDADNEERISNSNYTGSNSIQSWIDGLVTSALEGKSNYERLKALSGNYI